MNNCFDLVVTFISFSHTKKMNYESSVEKLKKKHTQEKRSDKKACA
jgi:hypothetical protein